MKKLFYLAFTLCFVSCFLFAGCEKTPPSIEATTAEEEPIAGGWSEDRAVTDEDMEVFNEAMNGLLGIGYEPTLVATQVVAGLNYRFTATATPVIPDPEPYQVYVFIFKPLEGPAELVNIENVAEG